MKLADFWAHALRRLYADLSEQQFNRDIAPITVGEDNGVWVIYAKNQFAVNLLRSQYASRIMALHTELAPNAPELTYKVGVGESVAMAAENPLSGSPKTEISTENTSFSDNPITQPENEIAPIASKKTTAQDILAQRMNNLRPTKKEDSVQAAPKSRSAIEEEREREEAEQRHTQTNLSPDYTFDTLVEGKGNQLAAQVAKSIAEAPGDSMYNPFFVYGSTGLGKTHLVQAIGNELLRLNPKARVRYMHSDEYLKTFMATVRNKTWDTFKQQYLHYNLLIIDDIQFIQGKDRTMEEFFFLFEHFHSRNQQIILTCDQLPSSLENMEKRLISRFSWGMTIRLEPPELEMRVDILERKAHTAGIRLEEDAALFIAQNVKQNVRELEGALNRVIARCRFEKRSTIDIDLATDALQDIVASNYKPITVELIMKAVADHYHITIRDILGKKRSRNLARPRQMAMAITKELTNLSLPAIGEAFGGRDHTTVMHAVKTIAKLRQDDPELKQDYDKLLIVIQH
ncbi:chromosomal replication initiator protein DnaA [Wielerella bovis]|uniref:chromosomal replication initiator protein DnaA n=1 Tax=Wielerella bovis TaxID=2917790 RepID=UPI0020196AED|nr:chromosomal replication initiator protein DnaA [Wielerella bovis]ULJ69304.1 chromosomal replication initiator protein DnaA [Wielerella bovis]